jgi:hypothetical protein
MRFEEGLGIRVEENTPIAADIIAMEFLALDAPKQVLQVSELDPCP